LEKWKRGGNFAGYLKSYAMEAKPYQIKDSEPLVAKEPVAAYQTAYESERLYSAEPCIYSSEEMRASVMQRKKDFDSGRSCAIPHEQLKRRSA
jgi:4'-phosphopantetheinyl transferase EntD